MTLSNNSGLALTKVGGPSTLFISGPTYSNTWTEGGLEIKQTSFHEKTASPKVFFRFIKKKLKEEEIYKIQKRLILLRKSLEEANMIGQDGLSEECMRAIVLCAREIKISTILRLPIRKIDVGLIYKYMNRVVEDKSASEKKKVVKYTNLKAFPRAIPEKVACKIRDAKRAELFDEYTILYLDYSEQQEMKATEQKVREKDPVLFGSFKENPNTLYFIAEWIDEVCDLTFNQIVDKMADELTMPIEDFVISDLVKDTYIKKLQKKIEENKNTLAKTGMGNWRENERKEQKKSKIRQRIADIKYSFYEFKEFIKAWLKG